MVTYGFHPNSPSLMRQPALTERGQVDDALVMSTLANKHQASQKVSIVNTLTTIYPNEVNKFINDINVVNKDRLNPTPRALLRVNHSSMSYPFCNIFLKSQSQKLNLKKLKHIFS